MKTKDFDSYPRSGAGHLQRQRGKQGGPHIGTAILGFACVIGVFTVLTLLYHFG